MNNLVLSLLEKYRNNIFIFGVDDQFIKYQDILSIAFSNEIKKTNRKLVFCIVENTFGGIAGYVALLAAGAVPMMIRSGLPQKVLDDLISTFNPEYIFLAESDVIRFPYSTSQASFYDCVLIGLNKTSELILVHDELTLLLSTSGSTGSGKFVRLSDKNVWSNAQAIANYLKLTSDEIPITTLPPTYSYGLSVIHSHLWVGAGLAVINKSFFDRDFWSFLRAVKATSLAGVPYHYQILKKLRFTIMELPHLRTLTQAGGRMTPDLTQEYAAHCDKKGLRFFTMYGQTEASPRMSYVPAEQAYVKAGTIGIPIPGGSLELQSETGRVLTGSHVVGEMVFRGPNVCLGYAESRADLSLGDVNHGILHTGDLAERDADGYYRIVGRQKRFIKLFGNRVNLQDVEQVLSGVDAEVACAGRDDLLEVYLVAGCAALALEIKQAVMSSLRVGAQGVAVYGLDSLPRNESGKVRYADLHPEKGQRLA
jgi:long-chain acyl-CoA synthetase